MAKLSEEWILKKFDMEKQLPVGVAAKMQSPIIKPEIGEHLQSLHRCYKWRNYQEVVPSWSCGQDAVPN